MSDCTYYTHDRAIFWKWDGVHLKTLNGTRWVRSIFTTPNGVKRMLGEEKITQVQVKDLPENINP